MIDTLEIVQVDYGFWIKFVIGPIYDADCTPLLILKISKNITEYIQYGIQLPESLQRLDILRNYFWFADYSDYCRL